MINNISLFMKMSRNLCTTFIKMSIILILMIFSFGFLHAQPTQFSRQDTLRGSITPEREWWDLVYYDLKVKVDPNDRSIAGTNTVYFKVLKPYQTIQIDLQEPMNISKVTQNGKELDFTREGSVFLIQLADDQIQDKVSSFDIHFSGRPKVSERPPWEGGITWAKDENGNHFIANSNQGDGASVWWPCKDHAYDEVDSMQISVTVPQDLMDVSNGRLREVIKNKDKTKTYVWFVSNPVNNYGVNISIGDYVHFSEVYDGEQGPLDCDYYVLRYNKKKAVNQFKDVPKMFEAFEYWFGPYPFYKDGYKLVEVPYLGMEHQSCVTYGNGYQNGYLGTDLSGTGWGLKFDFIIIHESGHEWFANSITYRDPADMWVHEGFTAYSENLFLDYHYGKEASAEYVKGTRMNILNDTPVIGQYNVNNRGSGDMYSKGSNLLHMLRQMTDDDEKWRKVLRGLNETFYHQTVTSSQVEEYLASQMEMDLKPFFDQYLRDDRIPILEYATFGNNFYYKWSNCKPDFNMPVRVFVNDTSAWIKPVTEWTVSELNSDNDKITVDPNFYISSFQLIDHQN